MSVTSRKNVKVYIVGAVILIGLALLAAAKLGGPFGKEDRSLGVVTKGELVQRITVAGAIAPARRTVISTPYSGYVQKIYVQMGQKVKAGDPIVALVQSARASGEPVYPLRAPFAGIVVQITRNEGEFVDITKDPNSGIVRIDDLTGLYINCEVPESDITSLVPGLEVVIKPNSSMSREYKGTIRSIAQAAKDGQWGKPGDRVNFDVRIEFLDQDNLVRPGMSAIVDIITAKKEDILLLPHEYIEKSPTDFIVTLANGERRKIQVGLANEDAFEIVSGLKENDRVKLVDFYNLPPAP